MKGKSQYIVEEKHTALALGSGSLLVYGTPALVALMEAAACEAIASTLAQGVTTVGTKIEVEHIAATPVGLKVWAEATLKEKKGRIYIFDIQAYDETGLIGKGYHERAALDAQRFLVKTLAKKEA